ERIHQPLQIGGRDRRRRICPLLLEQLSCVGKFAAKFTLRRAKRVNVLVDRAVGCCRVLREQERSAQFSSLLQRADVGAREGAIGWNGEIDGGLDLANGLG